MAATPTVTQGLPGPWPECMTVRGLSGLFSARSVTCPVDPLDVSSIPGLTSGGLWVECIFRMFAECNAGKGGLAKLASLRFFLPSVVRMTEYRAVVRMRGVFLYEEC